MFTTYSGNTTTVTDQQGKSRESQKDGIGRLTNVWEDPSDLNYETVYTYDALDDLATVAQGGSRNRSFVNDSLKRLTSSTNPESATVTYAYDADSNVITKEDARSITITYAYDALNRMTGKTYSNGDPAVTYTYDQPSVGGGCYNVGHRTMMTDAGGSDRLLCYDPMGRELQENRTTNSIAKNTFYTYNLDGSLATLTYPSGTVLTYRTNAAEQPFMANTTSIKYITAASYSPAGALSSLTADDVLLTSTIYYNTRLQPCRISVKSSGTAPTSCTDSSNIGNILDYTYNFSLGTADNGNVMGITNNVDATRSTQFSYGRLNRIVTAETTSTHATSPTNCWGESYTEDQWGNLTTIGVVSSSYNGCTQESLSITVSANNQISVAGFSYDASGNVLADGTNTYTWNAESQIKSAGGVNYTYDGDGDRVQKSNGKIYWYGAGSEILDETDLSGNLTDEYIFFGGKRIARLDSSNNVVYYVADHLGTSRVVTSSTGAILDQSDFYPFGGERVLAASSGNTYKFEGKERDAETKNDDFGARYYSSQFGRWLSPDWSAIPAPVPYANLTNPQTLNLYAMVSDSPETFADLDGHTGGDMKNFVWLFDPALPGLANLNGHLHNFANDGNQTVIGPDSYVDKSGKIQPGLSIMKTETIYNSDPEVDPRTTITMILFSTASGHQGEVIGAWQMVISGFNADNQGPWTPIDLTRARQAIGTSDVTKAQTEAATANFAAFYANAQAQDIRQHPFEYGLHLLGFALPFTRTPQAIEGIITAVEALMTAHDIQKEATSPKGP